MDAYSFCYLSWGTGLPSEITAVLGKERFTSLAPLKHATEGVHLSSATEARH